MPLPDYLSTYQSQLDRMIEEHGYDRAIELVVGGQFEEVSMLEKSLLIHLGLKPTDTLVDVGTGSGRLPYGLRDYLTGKFIGTDILEEALRFARDRCERRDWTFARTTDIEIPVPEHTADFVTFFSVFTHLLDEDIYRFLAAARRALRPDGRIVFSFLDFDCDTHWIIFQKTVEDTRPDRVLNKFTTKDTIRRLTRALGLREEQIRDGTDHWIPILEPVDCEDGRRLEGVVGFGQSVAVLSVFPENHYLTRYPDVAAAVAAGDFTSGAHHFDTCGFREGRSVG
ncbi:class I SAM-dependent methyltransferase [Synoicihabitans lomoniglobus]|uniref:Class I SAM-dependent methyltransferase n=1 Tax=Synoicihabitans lomoniglobus TaxID=2909285 RepID=A0AAE9ZUW1_9BACT|nr:class I SAM-dependent methyltransferase [Opitutaceae bacterium LMO-M01]WED65550.1 class I SAM-dependent methyltransferase [Opitutaceae bacterium LMO-M01]